MRALTLLTLAFAALPAASAQTVKAVTEDGRSILVHSDGTWTPDSSRTPPPPAPPPAAPIGGGDVELDLAEAVPPPPAPPVPPPPAFDGGVTGLRLSSEPPDPPVRVQRTLLGAAGTYALDYDGTRWSWASAPLVAEEEFGLTLPFGAGYASVIYEVAPFPLGVMRDLVLTNASEGGRNEVHTRSEESVSIGGKEALRLVYEVEISEGFSVTFINTIHSGDAGTIQVITWTASTVFDRFRDELLEFHNGLRLVKSESGE